jgi:hypothetical protein
MWWRWRKVRKVTITDDQRTEFERFGEGVLNFRSLRPLDLICARLGSPAAQVGQLGDIHRDPSRFVVGQPLGRSVRHPLRRYGFTRQQT